MVQHDFGRVLSTGQELRHHFRLTNPTDRPLRLTNPTAYTPCCSTIGPLPESIPAGGEIDVPVTFRTGGQKGRGRLVFSVESPGPERIIWHLELTADLLPAWEVVPVTDQPTRLAIGRAGEVQYRVITRRQGGLGLAPPDGVEGSGGLDAAFDGPTAEETDTGGLVTAVRNLRITLPATSDARARAGTIRLRWTDGATKDHAVSWSVFPLLTCAPEAIVLAPSSGEGRPVSRSITIRSLDRPIRILAVTGPLAEIPSLPTEARSVHTLDLAIDPARLGGSKLSGLLVRTDHADQPDATVTVFRRSIDGEMD